MIKLLEMYKAQKRQVFCFLTCQIMKISCGLECMIGKFHKKDLRFKSETRLDELIMEKKCELVRLPKQITLCEMHESHIGYAFHNVE